MMAKEDQFRCEVDFSDSSKFGPLAWLVRPCEWYAQEYKDCRCIRGRIHQYFISGSFDSCDGWRDDYYNCTLFRKSQDPGLLKRIINSELDRKQKRLAQSRANDTWEYRTEPPADWNAPITNRNKSN